MDVDLSDYYSGGYFLVKAQKPDWENLKNPRLADKLISLSICIGSHLMVYWGWQPGDKEAALKFGIPAEKLTEFVDWCNSEAQSQIEYQGMFYSTASAQQFVKRFLLNTQDLFLVGIGLHKELEESRWRESPNDKSSGIDKRIEQRLTMENGGKVLGFDVLSYSYSDFAHSWLCSYSLQEVQEMFGVIPNPDGLFTSYEDARKVDQWIFEDDMKGARAEPEPYDVWLLMSYPLTSESSPR
jgi:hypothetical protein